MGRAMDRSHEHNQSDLPLPAPAPELVVEDEVTAARAQEVCAHLLIQRWLPKRSYRDLLIDDALRTSVERRLAGVGLALVDSYTSNYFAVRLLPAVESDVRLDWATNARLQRGAVALLVILWTRLVLPRRVASDEARKARLEAGDAGGEVKATREKLPTPTVARTALFAEFGHRFGKTAFARYLGQLKAAGFVLENRAGDLREGPLLDNLVDGVTMARKLRDSVLWDLLAQGGHDEPVEGELPGIAEQAVRAASAPAPATAAAKAGKPKKAAAADSDDDDDDGPSAVARGATARDDLASDEGADDDVDIDPDDDDDFGDWGEG